MNILLIIILSSIAQLFAPWYAISIVPFIIFLWNPGASNRPFWVSFAGVSLPWLAYCYYLHFISDGAISDRIASIFSLPSSGLLLLLVSVLVAGLTGGFAGLAGYSIREIFRKPAF